MRYLCGQGRAWSVGGIEGASAGFCCCCSCGCVDGAAVWGRMGELLVGPGFM
jgi:hypothetical protein